jgi:hypothetical protein
LLERFIHGQRLLNDGTALRPWRGKARVAEVDGFHSSFTLPCRKHDPLLGQSGEIVAPTHAGKDKAQPILRTLTVSDDLPKEYRKCDYSKYQSRGGS